MNRKLSLMMIKCGRTWNKLLQIKGQKHKGDHRMWEWKNIYRGMIMGASDVIPGVSGGTIAVMLGIYDRLIAAINGIFSKEWKTHLRFLIPLGLGVVTSILLLARVIEWLFEHYPAPTQFLFMGLIIGVIPYLAKKSEMKYNFKPVHYVLLLIGAVIVASMVFFKSEETAVIQEMTAGTYTMLFFSGFIASAAMILPGISGSFILLIIGIYSTVISGISNFQLDVIFVVGVGILLGIIVMSKLIKFFLENYSSATYALIIGLVIGSIVVIYPGIPEDTGLIVASVVTFLVGLFFARVLGRIEYS
jgi:putative membrane protein